ncbi:MAG: endonuclease III [Armatimonadetes bacterium]|nr:endonuclease III [Armatimonadota bacterium]
MAKLTADSVAAETAEQRANRGSTILRRLRTRYDPVCALVHHNPLQLLIATILSAQTTDEQVNKVTPELFRRYPGAAAFAATSQEELEGAIASIGLFRNKAKSIRGACAMIVEQFGGEVPRSMKQLLKLPGVARKTANVVLGTGFGLATGVVVDTHVQRLSRRMGLTEEELPEKIERNLMQCFPKPRWIEAGHNLIWHGRKCCRAQKPQCSACVCADLCPRIGVEDAT